MRKLSKESKSMAECAFLKTFFSAHNDIRRASYYHLQLEQNLCQSLRPHEHTLHDMGLRPFK